MKWSEFIKQSEGPILLIGKSDYFTDREIDRFLRRHGMELRRNDGVGFVAVLEGRRTTPAEELISEALYKEGVPHFRIGELERQMSEALQEKELLMSLKLGYDPERLLRLLENEHLPDTLFLKLLKLWRWEGEGLMEGERDARILTALLRRFLEAGEYESDIYHSPASLLRLVRQTRSPELLEGLLSLPPFTFRQQRGRSLGLHEAIASREILSLRAVETLRRRREPEIDRALAANPATPTEILSEYLVRKEVALDTALAANPSLDDEAFAMLLERGGELPELLCALQRITLERWSLLHEALEPDSLPAELGANPAIDPGLFREIYELAGEELRRELLANPALPEEFAAELAQEASPTVLLSLAANPALGRERIEEIHHRVSEEAPDSLPEVEEVLAANPSTPVAMLEAFYELGEEGVLRGLAANPSTPMEILHQLKLEFSLYPIVSQNPAFVEKANFEMGMR
ncbi:hypothetical protein [Nitratifractor sp.]